MFKSVFRRSAAPAPTVPAPPAPAFPVTTPPAASTPAPWQDTYLPRFGSYPVCFDYTFPLRLARAYDDVWATESSLLATPTAPVSVWVRNQRDELVAHHVFTSAPIELGQAWWPGIYSLYVEHLEFNGVLCAVKQGPWGPQMPPLDLLAAPNQQAYPAAPHCPSQELVCIVDADTSAHLLD